MKTRPTAKCIDQAPRDLGPPARLTPPQTRRFWDGARGRGVTRHKGGRLLPVLLLLVAGVSLLAACGGSDSGDVKIARAADVETVEESVVVSTQSDAPASDVTAVESSADDAASDDGAAADVGASGNDAPDNFQDAALEFAQCLRGQGLDVPDPDFSGSGSGGGGGLFRGSIDPNDPDVQAALDICISVFEGLVPNFDADDLTALQDQILELAQCLRDQGLDVADPDFSQGFGSRGGGRGFFGSNLDPNDPQVRAALEQCREFLPSFGGGGPGQGAS